MGLITAIAMRCTLIAMTYLIIKRLEAEASFGGVRPVWAKAALGIALACGVMAFVLAPFLLLVLPVALRGEEHLGPSGALAAALENDGFNLPRADRLPEAGFCPSYSWAYRWTAMDAQGHACVRKSDVWVSFWIDRTSANTEPKKPRPGP